MTQQMQATVVNNLFPHVDQQQITLIGKPAAVNAVADLVNRGFQADTAQSTVYDVLARYAIDHLSQPGEILATPQLIRECYFSDHLRNTAAQVYPTIFSEPFISQHRAHQNAADLGNNRALLPFVFQVWFNEVLKRFGGTPVTHVGVVTRRTSVAGAADQFLATLYPNPATSGQGTCVWFVFDSLLLSQSNANPWAALVRPAVTPHVSKTSGSLVSIGNSSSLQVSPYAEFIVAGQFSSKGQAPPSQQFPPGRQPLQNIHIRPDPNRANQAPPCLTLRTSRGETRHITGAPSWDTALPWNLLADCTLEELLIYYPNHVLNWPGIALLYAHYSHRIVGENWTHTAVARRVAESRGLETKNLSSRFRQWILFAGNGLIKSYDPEETRHYQAIYTLVQQHKAANVSTLLQSLMQRPPARVTQLRPTTPLHQVGASIIGTHPTGNFANRVQAAMSAARQGIADPDATVNQPVRTPQSLHPMIWLLSDTTRTWEERRNESIYQHNQTATHDRFIRPVELFNEKGKRDFKRKAGDDNGQIWEWVNAHQTVIDYLDERLTREDLVKHHWRDLNRDAYLWLDLGLAVNDWMALLPNAALLEFKLLGSGTEGDREAAITTYKARQRKAKQMAFEARLKGVADSQWDERKKRGTNSSLHPDNKKLYLEEKARFDAWAKQQGLRKRPVKHTLEDTDEAGPSTKRTRSQRVGLVEGDIRPLAPTQSADPLGLPNAFRQTQAFAVDFNTILPDPPQIVTDDNEHLYNIDYSDGLQWTVHRTEVGNGRVPDWWRAARRQLINSAGVTVDDRLMEQYFDQGIDIIPDSWNPGRILTLPGNFIEAPAPSPPHSSMDDGSLLSYGMNFGQDALGFSLFENAADFAGLPIIDPALLVKDSNLEGNDADVGNAFGFDGYGEPFAAETTSDNPFEFGGFDDLNDAMVDAFMPYAEPAGVIDPGFPEFINDMLTVVPNEQRSLVNSNGSPPTEQCKRRSPRGYNTDGPRRRSPRKHSGSSP